MTYVPTQKKKSVNYCVFYSTLTAELANRAPATLWKCPQYTISAQPTTYKSWKPILQVPQWPSFEKTPKALPPERLSGDVLLGHVDIWGEKCGEGIAWKKLTDFEPPKEREVWLVQMIICHSNLDDF